MTVQTSISLDATVYRAIEERVGPEGVSDFVNDALSKVLGTGESGVCREEPTAQQDSGDYFEAFTEKGRTIAEMAKCRRDRLALLRKDLHRADFPPSI